MHHHFDAPPFLFVLTTNRTNATNRMTCGVRCNGCSRSNTDNIREYPRCSDAKTANKYCYSNGCSRTLTDAAVPLRVVQLPCNGDCFCRNAITRFIRVSPNPSLFHKIVCTPLIHILYCSGRVTQQTHGLKAQKQLAQGNTLG